MEPEEKTEEQLAAELEAMYKRVASIERPAETEDLGDEIPVHQQEEIMRLSSEAGVVETARGRAAEIPPAVPPQRRRSRNAGALAVIFVCICVLIYGAIFWPTLYEAAMIQRDGNLYPVRINRITGHVAYFDGGQWRPAPIPASRPAVPATPVPVAAALTAAAPPVATLPQKEALPGRRQAHAPAAPQAQNQTSSAHGITKQAPPRGGGTDRFLAVQIKSFEDPAEARKLVDELRKTGMEADSVAVTVGDRGIWNRVLVGRFTDPEEASKFMREHKIKAVYPDSFIQKRSP